jgi:hypothetical protein
MNRRHARRAAAALAVVAAAAAVAVPLALAGGGPPHPGAARPGTAAPAQPRTTGPGTPGTGTAGAGAATPASPRPSSTTAGNARAVPPARNQPASYVYGTDSWPITINRGPPYRAPGITGAPVYGGYIGMAGNWARWSGCGGNLAWSSADSNAANTNYRTYHQGIGTGVYWFMAGPGVDPHYNGTAAEAAAWGRAQAAQTLRSMSGLGVTYPVVWLDIELPGIRPAPDNGWNAVYTSPCSGVVRVNSVPSALDRADVNGYEAYLSAHSSYTPGVYSSPLIWNSIFGTGSEAQIPTTDEWTYSDGTSRINPAPSGWCIPGTPTCAQFFGGVTSSSRYALMWQWSGGGGIGNGIGDFDQINTSRVR